MIKLDFKARLAPMVEAVERLAADARARVIVAGAVSAALALVGLHLTADQVLEVMTVGAVLGGIGPHTSATPE